MKDYASLRKQNNVTLAAVLVLLVCLVISTALLMGRLLAYTQVEQVQRIPLTKSNGVTHVTSSTRRGSASTANPRWLAATPVFLTAPGAVTRDENTVWQGQTEVEIFSIRYDNASGETTVHSSNGAKVLAPGVGGSYSFELENTGDVSLDCTMEMNAWFSDSEYPIPIYVRVTDHQGNFLLGSESEMVDVLRLNEVSESGTVAAGHVLPYTLEWEWPFEQDDAYDTLLGNLAVEQDITLTIEIKTTATCSEDSDNEGGVPPTGDSSQVELYAVMMVVSLAGILLLLLPRRKEEANEAS